jgi:hypothetical protein
MAPSAAAVSPAAGFIAVELGLGIGPLRSGAGISGAEIALRRVAGGPAFAFARRGFGFFRVLELSRFAIGFLPKSNRLWQQAK